MLNNEFAIRNLRGVRVVSAEPTILQPILAEALKRHGTKVFTGDPAYFASWLSAWESFLATAKATSMGVQIPDEAILISLESWLDEASKKMLRAARANETDLT